MKYSGLRVFDRMVGRGKNIDISFSTYPELGNTEVSRNFKLYGNQKEVTLGLNKGLKDYLAEFPVTDEWDIYVRASLSPGLKKQLYPFLGKLMEGAGASESLDRLLNFIQTAFDYKTDTEQFGHERPFYGDESFSILITTVRIGQFFSVSSLRNYWAGSRFYFNSRAILQPL